MSKTPPDRATTSARDARVAVLAFLALSAATAGCSLGWRRSFDGGPPPSDVALKPAPDASTGGPVVPTRAAAASPGARRTPGGRPPTIPEDLRVRLRVWDHAVPVDRVIDGDTLRVFTAAGRSESVRLIGMNAPEKGDERRAVQCFGRQASEHLAALIGRHDVWLAGDPTQTARDTYGRLLAYVWTDEGDGAVLLNEAQIADGYANEATYGQPYAMRDAFRAAAAAARDAKRGLWSPTTCAGDYDAPPVP